MKVIDHIKNSNDTQFSYEIIPPLRGKGIKIVLDMVESLKKFNPPFCLLYTSDAAAEG